MSVVCVYLGNSSNPLVCSGVNTDVRVRTFDIVESLADNNSLVL